MCDGVKKGVREGAVWVSVDAVLPNGACIPTESSKPPEPPNRPPGSPLSLRIGWEGKGWDTSDTPLLSEPTFLMGAGHSHRPPPPFGAKKKVDMFLEGESVGLTGPAPPPPNAHGRQWPVRGSSA